ncbi:Fcf2-domain-containing protein [Patellaria atrata CBS 101060]|uniref:Fcf2-domain-containing protein n=1 Tax=Patellaria atrata CBS 101060 TaxID=1346257 RepID=A0A9P4SF88_9PEZI|nr:Fcf2-domain-containing protein [Patellaria atrata CBS 101060]
MECCWELQQYDVDPLTDNEDLTDEQIQELLKQAEIRLRAKAETAQNAQIAQASSFKFPKLDTGAIVKPYVRTDSNGVAKVDSSRLVDSSQRELSNKVRKVEDKLVIKRKIAEEKKATAGPSWYNLPRTELTPELRRDLQLLKMRNVLDPHRHYKKENGRAEAPPFSQVGTIIEGPTEYFSARIQNKDRKRTLVDEVLAGEATTGRFKRKYADIQSDKTSGKKAYYKALKAKRSGKNKR